MSKNENLEKLLNTDTFKNVPKEKQDIIKEMLLLMDNKTTDQKLQIMLAYSMKMKNMGLGLTTKESQELMNSLKEYLNESEKQKIDMMIKLIGMM